MFEDALITRLSANGELGNRLSTFGGLPAIFSDLAHKDADRPYLVVTIDREQDDNKCVDVFTVDVDFYEVSDSRKTAREVVELVEFELDMAELYNDRYDTIRFYKPSSGPIAEKDPKVIHYNLQFDVRAGRKKWMGQLT